MPDGGLGRPGSRQHGVEIGADIHPGLAEHVHQFLGGDVPAGAGRERAATQATDR